MLIEDFEEINTNSFRNGYVSYCAVFSVAIHLLIAVGLFGVFAGLKITSTSQLASVSVISGDTFKKIKNNFKSKESKYVPVGKNSTIKKIAANEAISQKIGSKNSISDKGLQMESSNSNNIDNGYVNILANQLKMQKSLIDLESAPNGVKTTVIVKMRLDKSGNLSSYELIKESDNIFFDKVAKKIVKLASPFPKPPIKIASSSLEFIVPIFFDTTP